MKSLVGVASYQFKGGAGCWLLVVLFFVFGQFSPQPGQSLGSILPYLGPRTTHSAEFNQPKYLVN